MIVSKGRLRRHFCAAAALLVAAGLLACQHDCPSGTTAKYELCLAPPADAGQDAPASKTNDDASDSQSAGEHEPFDASGPDACASDGSCIPDLYVDSMRGKDDNDGSELFPFRTFAKAMRVAVSGQTVNFEGGTYSALTGDDLSVPVPDGVAIQTRAATTSTAVFDGQGSATMTFAGNASVYQVGWVHFACPVRADRGKQTLRFVYMEDISAGLLLSGTAHLACQACTLDSDGKANPTITARGSATVELEGSRLSQPIKEVCLPTIALTESASLSLNRVTFEAGSISADTSGSLELRNATIRGRCFQSLFFANLDSLHPTSTIEIDGSTFESEVFISAALAVKARRSYFVGGTIGLDLVGGGLTRFDLGVPPSADGPGEAGENVFLGPEQRTGLRLGGSNNTVQAYGNTWMLNAQGAGQFGQYSAGTVFTAHKDEPVEGRNVTIIENVAGAESRVRL